MTKKIWYAFKEKGARKTLRRFFAAVWRKFPHHKDVLFYAEPTRLNKEFELPDGLTLECLQAENELKGCDREQFFRLKGEKITNRQIKERFYRGGRLWLLKNKETIACFVWSFQGDSYDHFFPVTDNEVYYVDGGCFPECRGINLFAALFNQMLMEFRKQGIARVYFATMEWNTPMLRCAAKIAYKKFAVANRFSFFGRHITIWHTMVPRG